MFEISFLVLLIISMVLVILFGFVFGVFVSGRFGRWPGVWVRFVVLSESDVAFIVM